MFCDTFSIPEVAHIPALFELLHSFCLWGVADPSENDVTFASDVPFETALVRTASKYLDVVRAWHIA